jgi:hypothetical protein
MYAAMEFGRGKLRAKLKCDVILVVKKTRIKGQAVQVISSGGYS